MVSRMRTVDVAVIGGGHHGLVAAAYLADRGLEVTVLERGSVLGGTAGDERLGTARVGACSCDHSLIRASGILEELDLSRHGLRYVDLDPINAQVPLEGGGSVWWLHQDPARTVEGLGARGPAYASYLAWALPAARAALAAALAPPGSRASWSLAARAPGGMISLARLSRRRLASVIAGAIDPALGAGLGLFAAVAGRSPQDPGTGTAALGWALAHLVPHGRPVGGTGALIDALEAAIRARGATISLEDPVVALVPRPGGLEVRTERGALRARAVISTIDPERTRSLVGLPRRRPPRSGYETKIDAIVEGDLRPSFAATNAEAGAGLVIAPSLFAQVRAAHAARAGRFDPLVPMLANLPSHVDAAIGTPEGTTLVSLELLQTPFAASEAVRREAEAYLGLAMRAIGARPTRVLSARVLTPADYEARYGLERGYAPSYPLGMLATALGRIPERSRYRSRVPGLYLAGAGTFPGPGVTGVSGRNAALLVADRLAPLSARRSAEPAWTR